MLATQTLHLARSSEKSFLQILGASLLIALFAQIEILLPFTPIPITGQSLGVLLVGAFLGSRKGSLSVLLYLAEGAMGLPVFSGGASGFFWLAGPGGGYLAGFVLQAYLMGMLLEKGETNCFRTLAAALLACATQMACGILWLSLFVGWSSVLALGLYPFIPGELLKAIAITTYLKWKS
ncbi:MAG: biotin transporter BioY [Parachlamydia sp.]|nr:biotin transporter BioY [Parachlamydia sp.]